MSGFEASAKDSKGSLIARDASVADHEVAIIRNNIIIQYSHLRLLLGLIPDYNST